MLERRCLRISHTRGVLGWGNAPRDSRVFSLLPDCFSLQRTRVKSASKFRTARARDPASFRMKSEHGISTALSGSPACHARQNILAVFLSLYRSLRASCAHERTQLPGLCMMREGTSPASGCVEAGEVVRELERDEECGGVVAESSQTVPVGPGVVHVSRAFGLAALATLGAAQRLAARDERARDPDLPRRRRLQRLVQHPRRVDGTRRQRRQHHRRQREVRRPPQLARDALLGRAPRQRARALHGRPRPERRSASSLRFGDGCARFRFFFFSPSHTLLRLLRRVSLSLLLIKTHNTCFFDLVRA